MRQQENTINSISYISDPLHELQDKSCSSMIPSSWNTLSQPNQIASEIQVRRGICSSDAFVFHGLGRACTFLNVSELVDADLQSCHAVILVDGADNDESLRRVERSKSRYMSSYNTAALFSVLGANAILLNRLPARMSENKEFLKRVSSTKAMSKMMLPKKDKGRCSRNRYNAILYGMASLKFK